MRLARKIPILCFVLAAMSVTMCLRLSIAYGATDEQIEKKQCEKEGGKWFGSIVGRGRTWGCVHETKDAEKPCSDGSECESGYCLAAVANCKGELLADPRGTLPPDCQVSGKCYHLDFPPKGCEGFLERGKYVSKCLD